MACFLEIERDGPVLVVTMNRPETRNALAEPGQFREFEELCSAARRDRSINAIVLTGAGPAFCAGGNVKDMRDRAGMFAGAAHEIRDAYRDGIQRIPLALYELDVPVIAAINGPAVGAGLDLACMCDIRLASETAVFAESFVKLGLVPGDGGAWLLPRVIGMPRATIMALTGDTIDSRRALEWGLIAERLPAAELLPAARDLARRIAANPGHAVRMAKRLLREGQHMRLDSLLEMSAAFQALAHHTADHQQAVQALLDKRPSNPQGR